MLLSSLRVCQSLCRIVARVTMHCVCPEMEDRGAGERTGCWRATLNAAAAEAEETRRAGEHTWTCA